MPQLCIGISGWTYEPWRGVFYPEKLPQKRELEYASRKLNSIEINGSFYSLQSPTSYGKWYEETPDDFIFTLKGGRFITHIRRLKEVEVPVAKFLASGVLRLKEKLGPILWQCPPNLLFDESKFEAFFALLPRTTEDAAKMATDLAGELKTGTWLVIDESRPIRYAVEIRHASFQSEKFVALARKHNVAIVVADTAGKWPLFEDVTSDFMYLRLHGDEEVYVSGYTDSALDTWADRIKKWSAGSQPDDARLADPAHVPPKCKERDVFVYFDNDLKVRSPIDAMNLARKLGIHRGDPPPSPPESKPKKKLDTSTSSDQRWQFDGKKRRKS